MKETQGNESSRDEHSGTTKAAPLDATQDYREPDEQAARLVRVLDQYLAELKAGAVPDRAKLLAEHPELAEQLEACLAGIEFIHGASAGAPSSHKQLGDFRILREVGRGGMGAVYEAEQISLRRRVALKVLRFGSVSDPEAIERFQREAETVAHLHHTNIVPIFAVGSEHGVNYYAMQFIEGRSLDQVLREGLVVRGSPDPAQATDRRSPGAGDPRRAPAVIDPTTVAEWGLQAAEALAHAHARGVIHRDVKPSNLILDNAEGRIWLTDFGLAKRLDDVTLSMTGVLLGTPRYMSPEQAAAAHNKLDHRTDIYSLGASLYELATGQPVFAGDSPHKVISQILSAEPDPPRKHCPSLPRDLETILMKCLSKEPGQRYETARQLADDLRAFLDGRPIAARRASLVERTTRWLKRQRRSVSLTAGAVAVTLLLVMLGIVGGYAWQRSRLAFVMLKTDNPPLVAELLRDGKPVVPPATVPTQRRIEVPSGPYEMRLSSAGRLSQTFDILLEPGDSLDRKLNLDDQLLWGDVKLDRTYRLARFERSQIAKSSADSEAPPKSSDLRNPWPRTDVIALTNDGFRCIAGNDGSDRWELKLKIIEETRVDREGTTLRVVQPTHAVLKDGVRLEWPWDVAGHFRQGLGVFDARPWVVSQSAESGEARAESQSGQVPSFDLNRDGFSDLVVAARHQNWLLAVNGADGEPLWVAARGSAAETAPNNLWINAGGEAVPYPPRIVADQDGDGIAELLATFIRKPNQRAAAERWIELISGGNGKTIWRYDLPPELFQLPTGEEVPKHLMWFYGSGGSFAGGGGFNRQQHYFIRRPSNAGRSGPHEYLPTQPRVFVGQTSKSVQEGLENALDSLTNGFKNPSRCVMLMAGTHLVQLDLKSGKPLGPPRETGIRTGLEPRYGDFDGDGVIDVLMVEQLTDRVIPQGGGLTAGIPRKRVAAWSAAKQRLLWRRDIEADWPRQDNPAQPIPDWPRVTDLDGDGASDVLVPDGSTPEDAFAAPWGKLALLDGRRGEPRWHGQIFNMDRQLSHFIAGPDINGDGVAEVYVASQWGDDYRLFVDCLSGSDGQTLWRCEQPLLTGENETVSFLLANLSWYDAAGDGWPQLVVPARATEGDATDRVVLISAGTGRVSHMAPGVTDADPGDLDADGVRDLVLFRRTNLNTWDQGGMLHAFRGVGREAWRKIIDPQILLGDLNGDGVSDLVAPRTRGQLTAHCGATGEIIWQTSLDTKGHEFRVHPATTRDVRHDSLTKPHDLDGDGTPDFLAGSEGSFRDKQPLPIAISGRTGRRMWQTDFAVQRVDATPLLECRDLDRDGEAEIVLVTASDYGLPHRNDYRGTNDTRLWLAVLSGRDGRTRWSQPLTDTQDQAGGGKQYELRRASLEAAYGDLNGDQMEDLLLPAQRTPGEWPLDLLALSGSDGRTLWQSPLPNFQNTRESFGDVPPAAAGDLDGDGQPEVITLSLTTGLNERGGAAEVLRVQALDGQTGRLRWQWETPANRSEHEVRGDPERVKDRLRGVLLRRPDGKQWVAIASWQSGSAIHTLVHVLDEAGNLVSKNLWQRTLGSYALRLWPIDADGDGGDEVVFLSADRLELLPPDKLDQPIWRTYQPPSQIARILGVVPDESAMGRIVVQRGVGDNSLLGINPRTGDTVWTCVGPLLKTIVYSGTGVAGRGQLLSSPQADLPPHGLFQFGGQSLVRRGVHLTDDPRTLRESPDSARQIDSPGGAGDLRSDASARSEAWQTFARPAPTLAPAEYDPRLLRPLPWKPQEWELREMPQFLGWSAFFGVTLAAIPVLMAGWMIRRRRWGMKTMLMLPVVVGIVLLAAIISPENRDFHSLWNKLLIAFFAAGPVMFALAMFAVWLRQGRWRQVVIWLALVLLASLVTMAVTLFVIEPDRTAALQPGERYSWDGWYFMFLPVLYAMSWLLLIVISGWWLIRTIGRWFRGRGLTAKRVAPRS